MFNATVTVSHTGTTHDTASGYRKAGTTIAVLRDEPCLFSPERGSFSRNSDGIREFVKLSPKVIVSSDVNLSIGMTAVVTYRDEAVTYTVTEALPVDGFLTFDWQLSLERIAT